MKYDIHRFDINMEKDQDKLKQFLNSLKGEIVAIIPNVKPTFLNEARQTSIFCFHNMKYSKITRKSILSRALDSSLLKTHHSTIPAFQHSDWDEALNLLLGDGIFVYHW